MAKTFMYGGYTFEPRGQFKDFGIMAGKREIYHISHALHHASWENRFKVADGDEKFNYDEFYKAAGEKKNDVFYCNETGEMYVPCAACLQVFDQQSTDEEVEARYKLRISKRDEHERNKKRQALKEAMYFTEEQHQAYIELCKAVNDCLDLGMEFAYDGDHVSVFRADLLKDITTNTAPVMGQGAIDENSFCQCTTSTWDIREGLYANVKE